MIKFDEENYLKLLNQGNHLPSRKYYFQKGITWSLFGFENFGVRFKNDGFVFDVSGSSMFPEEKDLYYIIGYLCSNICFKFLSCLAPTVNFQVGNIASLPFKLTEDVALREKIDQLVKENIDICKEEWSFYETSIEFEACPFIMPKFKEDTLEKSFKKFEKYYHHLRNQLRKNEEELNKIYSEIFGVFQEVDCSVNDRDLTLKPFDRKAFMKDFLSYSIGCSVGRYHLKTLKPDYSQYHYNIKLDNANEFLKKLLIELFGKEGLEENYHYMMQVLNIKSIENYYQKEFMEYHQKIYQNHPIYFLQ